MKKILYMTTVLSTFMYSSLVGAMDPRGEDAAQGNGMAAYVAYNQQMDAEATRLAEKLQLEEFQGAAAPAEDPAFLAACAESAAMNPQRAYDLKRNAVDDAAAEKLQLEEILRASLNDQ